MAAASLSVPSPWLSASPHHRLLSPNFLSPPSPRQFHLIRTFPALRASRRSSSSSPQDIDEVLTDSQSPRWNRFDFDGYEDDDDDEGEEEEDRSLDLLVKFVENVFRKVSKRARKAVRSVLPVTISTKLVHMRAVLIDYGLWKVLQGPHQKPEKMTDEQWTADQKKRRGLLTDEEWEKLELKAVSAIQLYLKPHVLRGVLDKITAVGLWVRLEELYMTKSLANKIRLKEMLYTFRMAEGTLESKRCKYSAEGGVLKVSKGNRILLKGLRWDLLSMV